MLSSLTPPIGFDDDIQVAWTVIETLNLWSAFLRAYDLSGAIETRTMSSLPVYFKTVAFPTRAALVFAIRAVKNPTFAKKSFTRFDEPAWHSIGILLLSRNALEHQISRKFIRRCQRPPVLTEGCKNLGTSMRTGATAHSERPRQSRLR